MRWESSNCTESSCAAAARDSPGRRAALRRVTLPVPSGPAPATPRRQPTSVTGDRGVPVPRTAAPEPRDAAGGSRGEASRCCSRRPSRCLGRRRERRGGKPALPSTAGWRYPETGSTSTDALGPVL